MLREPVATCKLMVNKILIGIVGIGKSKIYDDTDFSNQDTSDFSGFLY